MSYKRAVLQVMLLDIIHDAVIENGSRQIVKTALYGQLRAPQALALAVGYNLQEGGLACRLHHLAELLHLLGRKSHILESPVLYRQIRALLKNLFCILDCHIMMCQHYD